MIEGSAASLQAMPEMLDRNRPIATACLVLA